MKRRDFLKYSTLTAAGVTGSNLLTGCASSPAVQTKKSMAARVVVIGGGTGGLTVAQTIKKEDPSIEVTVVEKNKFYSTCFGSNWVLSDIFTMNDITYNYTKMAEKYNINMVYDEAVGIDPEKKVVHLANMSQPLEYDRLVVSPGISFRWDQIEGHDETTSHLVPHAWKAGYQTMQLKEQINDMADDGTMVMVAPPNPFRCPPGPYERASMVAEYLKREKPKAKLLILDAKDKFSKFGLFTAGWEKHYGFKTDNATLEWVSKSNGGEVSAIDPYKKIITTKNGDTIKADVINYIPAQKANMTAVKLGLVNDSGWCPVMPETFESTLIANVHVLGDASIAKPMPKSAFAANSQGVNCGKAIVALLTGKQTDANATFGNQCYSLITGTHGISVAAGYKLDQGKMVKTFGGLFPKEQTTKTHKIESDAARGWYAGMAGSMFR